MGGEMTRTAQHPAVVAAALRRSPEVASRSSLAVVAEAAARRINSTRRSPHPPEVMEPPVVLPLGVAVMGRSQATSGPAAMLEMEDRRPT
jgi:hypothetical protein